MAKLSTFADLAGAIERAGRALHQGTLAWDTALQGALVSAVDDLKILLRASRAWGAPEDQRAAKRTSELSRFAPATQPAVSPANTPVVPATSYLASEASNVAAGLELLAARAGDADTAANVLQRVRALRGVAGVKEIAPLADTLEATEDAARGLELGEDLSVEARQLLETSGAYLRTLARAISGGADINAPSAARDAFTVALENWSSRAAQREQVVPIGQLFYDDGTAGVVESSPNPPTSSRERFRMELVSLGEHLRQVVIGARAAHDSSAAARARRDLKRAVRDAQMTAESFGETEIASFIEHHIDAAEHIDFLGLSALDDLAEGLAQAGAGGAQLRSLATEMAEQRSLASSIATGLGTELPTSEAILQPMLTPRAASPLAIETPAFTPAIVAAAPPVVAAAPPVVHPSAPAVPTHALDSASASLIDSSIAALDTLNAHPFLEPTPLPEDVLVPIDTLLYRGRAALDRAIEVRDEIRAETGGPSREALDELFDLLELARAE